MGLILAKAAGARTIITSSSDEKLEMMKKKYGVDETINYRNSPNWAEMVNKLTGGVGVDYILENGGSGTIADSISCIKSGGIISQIGFLDSGKKAHMPDVASLVLSKACILRGINVGSKQLLEELIQFTEVNQLVSVVDKTFPFGHEGVIAAYDYLQSGSHVGKVCISME
jgi:NADPH:quinone reductase-like Zn-dependent oxidoreductase